MLTSSPFYFSIIQRNLLQCGKYFYLHLIFLQFGYELSPQKAHVLKAWSLAGKLWRWLHQYINPLMSSQLNGYQKLEHYLEEVCQRVHFLLFLCFLPYMVLHYHMLPVMKFSLIISYQQGSWIHLKGEEGLFQLKFGVFFSIVPQKYFITTQSWLV